MKQNMKKTNRKNKTGLKVNWPAGFYTMDPSSAADHASIPSLLNHNSDFVKITLRVRLNNAIENNTVAVIGTLKGEKGRPKLVFANTPVSAETLEAAAKIPNLTVTATPTIINVLDVKATNNQTIEVEATEATEAATEVVEKSVKSEKIVNA